MPFFEPALQAEIAALGQWAKVPKDTTILRAGAYVQVIPVVIKGLVKVFAAYEDREVLLYYLRPDESCIMSFQAVFNSTPSEVFAITEENSELLLLPVQAVAVWWRKYPSLNQMFYRLYHQRYADLIHTIQQVLFQRMDERIWAYLREQSQMKGSPFLDLRHWQIAQDLGTAREVVSRVLRKLEHEQKIKQHPNGIEVCP